MEWHCHWQKYVWKVVAEAIDEHHDAIQYFGVVDQVKMGHDDSVEIIPKISKDFVVRQSKKLYNRSSMGRYLL